MSDAIDATQRVLVTGGAGFIGSNLVESLLKSGSKVRVVDNFSAGFREFLDLKGNSQNLELVEIDLNDQLSCESVVEGCRSVFHLAANADVRFGWHHPLRDTQQNLIVTQNLLEACRKLEVRRFVFTSTGSVYGRARHLPTPENCEFPIQTSLYAASKLAAEGLISAYCEAGFIDASVFRLVSILGPRYTHGHVFDFVKQLRRNSRQLKVLGDGQQWKSYLHVQDCVRALMRFKNQHQGYRVLNLGTESAVSVKESIAIICEVMGCNPEIVFTGGVEGWVGDNPKILLDTTALKKLGWQPTKSISESIRETVEWLITNDWVFGRR